MDSRKILLAVAKALALDLEKMVRDLGFDILRAKDGQEVFELAREEKPELIILERNLPVLDGMSVTVLLKDHPETRTIPIVAICEGRYSQDEEKARDAGCDAYLNRPVKMVELKAVIRKLMRTEVIT